MKKCRSLSELRHHLGPLHKGGHWPKLRYRWSRVNHCGTRRCGGKNVLYVEACWCLPDQGMSETWNSTEGGERWCCSELSDGRWALDERLWLADPDLDRRPEYWGGVEGYCWSSLNEGWRWTWKGHWAEADASGPQLSHWSETNGRALGDDSGSTEAQSTSKSGRTMVHYGGRCRSGRGTQGDSSEAEPRLC